MPTDNQAKQEAERREKFVNKFAETDNKQVPSVGRIVHYVSGYTLLHHAAIIADIIEDLARAPYVNLAVFDVSQNPPCYAVKEVPYDANGTVGTWHWPERV